MNSPNAPWRVHYPFQSHFFQLDEPGASPHPPWRLHYLDEGDPQAPPVVLVHGNPTWSFYFRHLIPALAPDHRVIVPDHLGCGLSDKPPAAAEGTPYTLELHIQRLEALLDHLEVERASLIVHDWGGAIGMGWATRHPERVDRLVVGNTAAFHVDFCPWRIRVCRYPAVGAFLVRGLNGFARAAQLFATSQHLPEDVRAGYLAPYDSWQDRVAVHRFVRDIPLEPHHPTRRTLDAIDAGLGQLAQRPMRIYWGDQDFCFTTRHFLPEWQQRFPHAEVEVFTDAGHYIFEDAHERIVPSLVPFLK